MNKLVDDQFYTGAQEAPLDQEDYAYDDYVAMAGEVKIDWEKGYDIRNTIGGHIDIKSQESSLSCVGQGWSYYYWVLQVLEMVKKYNLLLEQLREEYPEEVEVLSAKAVYSQIFLPNGGAYISRGGKLVVNWGAVAERLVPSHKEDGSVDEDFMRDLSWLNDEITKIAEILKGKQYRIIRARDNMDLFARAILENGGVVGGFKGQNGRGWGNSERPKPPTSTADVEWLHCVYFGAFGTDEKGKFIATPNSWNEMSFNRGYRWKPGDPVGKGWQKLYEDYFTRDYQFDPWTYTDLLNPPTEDNQDDMPNNFAKFIKDKNSPAVGIWLPFTSPETLRNMSLMYNKEVPMKADGGIDWDNLIEGTLELETKE